MAARTLGPAEFCVAGFGQASNGQARYLSGAAFDGTAPTEEELFRRALAALERVHYVGIFEAFRQSVADVAALAGVAQFDPTDRMNSAERISPVSPADRERIAACNRVDAALHAWALHRVA